MAHYDEIGEFGLDQVLARRLTTPGGAVAPTVAPELFGTLALESDRPEWGWVKGETRCARFITIAALAGNYSMAQLYLPSTARAVAVVTNITAATSNQINLARAVGISAGLGGWVGYSTATADYRWPATRTQVICETNQNAAPPTTNGVQAILVSGTTGAVFDTPIIVTPNTSLVIWMAAVNQALNVNVSWYERGAQPGELV